MARYGVALFQSRTNIRTCAYVVVGLLAIGLVLVLIIFREFSLHRYTKKH